MKKKSFLIRKTNLLLGTVLFFYLYFTIGLAFAIPFENIGWQTPGDNLLTQYNGQPLDAPYDEDPYDVSNLEWLNVELTLGLSFNAVLDETKVGGQFEGFRFATANEIVGLFRGPLVYADWMIQSGESPKNILEFADLLGIPYDPNSTPSAGFTGALYDYPRSNSDHTAGMLIYGDYGANSINQAVFHKDEAFPLLGSLLVREQLAPVPEPATIFDTLGDINSDGKIDLKEAIYALQVVSGYRHPEQIDSSIVGAWWSGSTSTAVGEIFVLIFFSNSTYVHVQNGDDVNANWNGYEFGNYSYNAETKVFSPTPVVDMNGEVGLSHLGGQVTIIAEGNTATINIANEGVFTVYRVK